MDKLATAIRKWLEAVEGTEIEVTKLLSSKVIADIVAAENEANVETFIKNTFNQCHIDIDKSSTLTVTLFLVYVAFSPNPGLVPLRDVMCTLDNSTQWAIREFLSHFTGISLHDVTYDDLEKAAALVTENGSPGELSFSTPSRLAHESDVESPLLTFFQTPQRKRCNKRKQYKCRICSGGERIKQLKMQMEEDDSEKLGLIKALKASETAVSDLEHKLLREVKRNENSASHVVMLENELEERSKQITFLEEKCKASEQQVAELLEDVAYSKGSVAEVTEQFELLEKLYSQTMDQISKLTEKNRNLESGLEELCQRNKELEEIGRSRSETVKELEEKLLSLQAVDEDSDVTMANSFHETESLAGQLLVDAREEIARLKCQLDNTNETISRKDITISKMQSEFDEKIATISRMQSKIDALIVSYEENVLELKNQKDRAEDELKFVSFNLESKVKEIRQLQTELCNAKENVDNMTKTRKKEKIYTVKLANDLSAANVSLVKLTAELCAKEDSVTQFKQDIERLKTDLKECREKFGVEKNIFEMTLMGKMREISTLTDEILELKVENERTKTEADGQARLIQDVNEGLIKFIDETADSSVNLNDIKKNLERVFEEKTKLKAAVAKLTTERTETDLELENFRNILNEKHLLLSSYELRITELGENLGALIGEKREVSVKLIDAEENLRKAVEEKRRLLSALESLTDEKIICDVDLESCRKTLNETQLLLSDCEQQIAEFVEGLGELEKNIGTDGEIKSSLLKALGEKTSLKFALEIFRKSILEHENCQGILRQKEGLVSECEKKITEVCGQLKNLEEDSDLLRKENGALNTQLNTQVQEIKDTLNSIMQQVVRCEDMAEEKESRLIELKLIMEKNKNTIEQMNTVLRRIMGVEITNEPVFGPNANLEDELEKIWENNMVLLCKLERFISELVRKGNSMENVINNEKVALSGELKISREKLEQNENIISGNAEEICLLKENLGKMTSELDEKRAIILVLEASLENLKQELECVNKKYEVKNSDFDTKLAKNQSIIEKLNHELDVLRSSNAEKQSTLEDLETELKAIVSNSNNEQTHFNNVKEIMLAEIEELKIIVKGKEEEIKEKTRLEQKISILVEENNNQSLEIERMGSELTASQTALEGRKRQLEQQAVEFNREKMKINTELEENQRDSATMLRRLEAKNLALDEVKNVAMAKVNELLKSHGQLRQELGDLVAYKSAENSKLDFQVQEARTKCEDLTSDLAHALSNVDAFKSTVQHLKTQQDKMKRLLEEKEHVILDLKKECESSKQIVVTQCKRITSLLKAFGSEDSALTFDDETDYFESFGKILDKFRSVMEMKNSRQDETLTLVNNLRSQVHALQCETIERLHIEDVMKENFRFWASPTVVNLVKFLEENKNMNEIEQACKAVLLADLSSSPKSTLEDLEVVMVSAKSGFLHLLKFARELISLADAREKLRVNLEEDYNSLEQRMLSLAEINSRLSLEIQKLKGLSSVELSMHEDELMSLKTTVSSLNEKIQKLTNSNDEFHDGNRQLKLELDAFKKMQEKMKSICGEKKQSETLLLNVLTVKEKVDKHLISLRNHVPEMLTVITTLEQRRDALTDHIFEAVTAEIKASDSVISVLDMNDTSVHRPPNKLGSVLSTLKNILENVELIRTKRDVEELSDSLEEVPVHEKTFPIINLHEDTFSMPPRVPDKPRAKGDRTAWVVSPPSKKKITKAPPVKTERNFSGESWVIPVGPAPAKPARKTESRTRTDSTSSTQSLPCGVRTRSVRSTSADRFTNLEVTVKQVMQEKQILATECQTLKARVAEVEEKRIKEREQNENVRVSTRQKYEKQLEVMKAEMKQLYNNEVAKHKQEQLRMTEELKKKNEDLRKENAQYKEDVDDLRSQLWNLGDKLLQAQNNKKDQDDRMDLSRQLDRMTLQPSDTWKSMTSKTHNGSNGSGARAQQPALFPPMPVEDEDEIFDNRCLEELKSGESLARDPQARLTELKIRNSLCLPHLRSSYPAETQFMSPRLFRDGDLRASTLPFTGSESQSLTDSSDPSMTRSLLPAEKTKKKEQTSYKRPGPPTPSKNGRPSLQGEVRLTPKRPLREQNLQDKSRGTPSRLKALFSSKSSKRESLGSNDENTAPSTPRGKGLRIFQRKPFGGRDF